MDKLKVIGWTNYNSKCQNMLINNDNQMEVLDAIVNDIKTNGYAFSGEDHQDSCFNCVPVFNNGKCFRATYRTFSSIMSMAYYNNTDNYMEFYMSMNLIMDKKLPSKEVNEDKFVYDEGHDALLPIAIDPDIEIIQSALQFNSPFITTDIALQAIYEYLLNKQKNEQ